MIAKTLVDQNRTYVSAKRKQEETYKLFSFLTDYNAAIVNSSLKILDPSLQLVCRVSTKGKIKFSNKHFSEATSFSSKELVNAKISSIFHYEMPKVVLEKIMSNLENNIESVAVLKCIDKKGETIWLNACFTPNDSRKLNMACSMKLNPSSKATIKKINHIYETIFLLENHVNNDVAEKYFKGLLEMEYGNYEGFMINAFQ